MDLKQGIRFIHMRLMRPFKINSRLSIALTGILLCSILLSCHRSEFGADQGTACPEPDGSLIVLDYTLNCLYVGDTPEAGCPDALPNAYFYRETYICSERSGAQSQYLNQLVDRLLDVDASVPPDMAAVEDSSRDLSLTSDPSTTLTADGGSADALTDPEPQPEPEPESESEPQPESAD